MRISSAIKVFEIENKCADQTAWMLWSVYLIESVPLLFACNKTRFYDFDGSSAICNDKFAMCYPCKLTLKEVAAQLPPIFDVHLATLSY